MSHMPEPTRSARPSDESSDRQLKLAEQQGEAYGQAVAEMIRHEAEGDQVQAGDMLVGVAVEHAEGMYDWRGTLDWQNPVDENAHIEVVVRDAQDGRFIPGLDVSVTVHDERGGSLGTHDHPFLWHPWLHHYGRNWILPGDGTYDLLIHVGPATFMRHDKVNGARFAEAVEVEFRGVRIETGQKLS